MHLFAPHRPCPPPPHTHTQYVGINFNGLADVFIFVSGSSVVRLENLTLEGLAPATPASLATVQGSPSSALAFFLFPLWAFMFNRYCGRPRA